jgi:hypothetical protein
MDAIKGEEKQREQGGYGIPRKWYVKSEVLDKIGRKQYKAGEGDNFLAIIPPPNPDKYFGLKIFVHYNIGPNNDAYLCKKMMKGEKCPLCERREQLKAVEAEESLVKALSCFPPRYLFWVVNMKTPETEGEGVQLYDAPQTINDEILGLSRNKRTHEMLDISDPDKGKVLVFERKGLKALNTEYKAFSLEDREPLPDKWLIEHELEEVLHYATDEEMLASLGTSVRKGPDGEVDPPPTTDSRARTRSTSAPAAEEKDDAPPPASERRRPVREPAPAPAAEEKKVENPPTTEAPAQRRRATPVREEPPAATEAPAPAAAEGDDAIRNRLRDRLARRRAASGEGA